MKYSPTSANIQLPQKERELLQRIRERKDFDPAIYVRQKARKLSAYFTKYKLTTALVAISGGIDSAVVPGILKRVIEDGVPIDVVGITLPALDHVGVTNQDSSADRAKEVMDTFDIDGRANINIAPLHQQMNVLLNSAFNLTADAWAQGQAIPYLRTAMLYSMTALLTCNGNRTVLVGTTNRDEGLYLGYIGKASDGIVDLQPISDLHKSEVRQVAEYLGVPQSILDITPTGDMFDGRTDEEVFGASYDCVELALNLMHMYQTQTADSAYGFIGSDPIVHEQMKNIDKLHEYNKHKYLGCSPAVHFDLDIMTFPNGWTYSNWNE